MNTSNVIYTGRVHSLSGCDRGFVFVDLDHRPGRAFLHRRDFSGDWPPSAGLHLQFELDLTGEGRCPRAVAAAKVKGE